MQEKSKPKSDVLIPATVTAFVFEEEAAPVPALRQHAQKQQKEKTRWLNTPNTYLRVNVAEEQQGSAGSQRTKTTVWGRGLFGNGSGFVLRGGGTEKKGRWEVLGAGIALKFGALEPLGVLQEWDVMILVNSFICPRVIFVLKVHLQQPVPGAFLAGAFFGFALHGMHLSGLALSKPHILSMFPLHNLHLLVFILLMPRIYQGFLSMTCIYWGLLFPHRTFIGVFHLCSG